MRGSCGLIGNGNGIDAPAASPVVVPAKAGTHRADAVPVDEWIPAFAGMTKRGACGANLPAGRLGTGKIGHAEPRWTRRN